MEESKINSGQKEAIVRTVVFFDMFDFPVTEFEAWKFSSVKMSLLEARNALKECREIKNKHGFYYLAGRREIVEKRYCRYSHCRSKFRRIMLITRIFKLLPWIKMVGIGNVMGANNMKKEGDLDFFIITGKKRIWITRFFSVLAAKTMGLRPKLNNARNKVCLSFFISDEDLNLNPYKKGKEDIYMDHWIVNLIPIFDKGGLYDLFLEKNTKSTKYFPNWTEYEPVSDRMIDSGRPGWSGDLIDMFFGGLENNVKNLQMRILPQEIRALMNKDTRVVVNDKILKFHVNDRRLEFSEKFNNKINQWENLPK